MADGSNGNTNYNVLVLRELEKINERQESFQQSLSEMKENLSEEIHNISFLV